MWASPRMSRESRWIFAIATHSFVCVCNSKDPAKHTWAKLGPTSVLPLLSLHGPVTPLWRLKTHHRDLRRLRTVQPKRESSAKKCFTLKTWMLVMFEWQKVVHWRMHTWVRFYKSRWALQLQNVINYWWTAREDCYITLCHSIVCPCIRWQHRNPLLHKTPLSRPLWGDFQCTERMCHYHDFISWVKKRLVLHHLYT